MQYPLKSGWLVHILQSPPSSRLLAPAITFPFLALPEGFWKAALSPLLPWSSTFLPESSTWSAQLLCSVRNMDFKESHKNTNTVCHTKGGLQGSSWTHRFTFIGAIPVLRGRPAKPRAHWAQWWAPHSHCVPRGLHRARGVCSMEQFPFASTFSFHNLHWGTSVEDGQELLSICLLTTEILLCGHLSAAGPIDRKE